MTHRAAGFVACAIVAAVSVPLIFGLIPPNRFYGVRTPRSLRDRDLWYAANAFGGWALLAAAVIGATLLWQAHSVPESAALVVPVLTAAAVTIVYTNRVGR